LERTLHLEIQKENGHTFYLEELFKQAKWVFI